MPVITKELFSQMLKAMDKDDDGSVDKKEFKEVYVKVFAKNGSVISDAEYDKVWAKIDLDKSGDLSVAEISKFFGFDDGKENSDQMTEEQILAALQMHSHLFDEVMKSMEKVEVTPGGGRRRASVIANKMPKPIGPKQMRQYLGLKACKVPTAINGGELDAAIKLLMACEVGHKNELRDEFFGSNPKEELNREILFTEDDAKGETPLLKLARHGLMSEIRTVVQMAEESSVPEAGKYFINLQDKKGRSAIFYAAEYRHPQLVEFLLTRGADPMMCAGNGWTVLHTATASAKAPEDDKKSSTDQSAATVDVILKHTAVLPLKKALINMADEQGRLAIHIASYKGVDAVTETLLAHGADPKAKDVHGNDPIKLANRSGRKKSKEILEEFIAREL